MSQLGLTDLIFRVSYLISNFNLPFIQGRQSESGTGCPCKAKIRYFGATDDGLVDLRPNIVLWGSNAEVVRWHELRQMDDHKMKSDTEISEMVLDKDWQENNPCFKD